MKGARNDETNPDMQPIRPPRIPSITNMQLSPSCSSVRNAKHREYFPGCFPPSPVSPTTAFGHTLASRFLVSCIVMHLFALYLLFLPPLLSLDTKTDAAATQYDYGIDDPSFSAELPGKPPLDHQISPILLYTACIRVV